MHGYRQSTDGEQGSDTCRPADGQHLYSLVPHTLPEGLDAGLVLRVRGVVDMFLQHLILRLEFGVLLLKLRYLAAESFYLRQRNCQLKLRLRGLRRWHVQYPPVDETYVSAVVPQEVGGCGDGESGVRVMPNVRVKPAPTVWRAGPVGENVPRTADRARVTRRWGSA